MQPSAQGIASLFMGNPGALAARVNQDRKQSPMGIPDDLRQLMALNIVTTENDAAKRQQALQQLQQMAPNGQPPTVAENVRQQAAQKLQARMVQEQQKAQAMQQMMGGLPAAGIPQGVPQPERQPQGIDEAPVEFGMASGGIVSFNGEGESQVPDPRRQRQEGENFADFRRRMFDLDLQLQRERNEAESARRESERLKRLSERSEDTMIPPSPFFDRAPLQIRNPNMTQETMRRVGSMTAPRFEDSRIVKNAPGITAALPLVGGSPAVQQKSATPDVPAASEVQDQRLTPQGMMNASSAKQLQDEAEFERRVGAPNTAALDKLMAEYERQKSATESPTGMAGLMEFMSQIASGARRGRTSMEAAAAGVTGTQALERERAAQRAALTEKQIGLEQQKINAARDYAKEVFGVGKAAYDKAYDRNFSMFKEQGLDIRAAQDRAQQLTLEDIRYKHQVERDKEQHRYAMIQRGTPTAEMEREEKRIKMYMDEQKAKGNTVSYMDAVQAVRGLGGNAGLENAQTRMLREARKDIDDRLEQLLMEGKDKTPEYAQLTQQRKRLSDMIVGRVLKEAGVSGEPSGGVDKNNPLLK